MTPVLVVGARNLGNNLRIIAYKKGKGLLQLKGEDADRGERDYFCLCNMEDEGIRPFTLRFMRDRVSHVDGDKVSAQTENRMLWALSGQPLLWNGVMDEDAVILNTYDLRHYWRIPTGEGRFGARGQAGKIVEELVTPLVEGVGVDEIKAKAAKLGLPREVDYLHSAIGTSAQGDLVLVQAHGSFEQVADKLQKAGATHAIELDEGGSVSTHFVYQDRKQKTISDSRIFASHYFRARASALLLFRLVVEKGERLSYVPTHEDSELGIK